MSDPRTPGHTFAFVAKGGVFLFAFFQLAAGRSRGLVEAIGGAFILTEVCYAFGRTQAVLLYGLAKNSRGISGSIMYAGSWLLTGRPFFAGGVVGCVSLAL